MTTPRVLEVRAKILKKNDELARSMRAEFARAGVFVANLVSSPGSGKTELLTRTLSQLITSYGVAAVVGDLATDNDARRLATSGAEARQIITQSICHLEADMVRESLEGWDLSASISYSLKTWAILSVRRAGIWARICESCSFP